MLDRRHSAQDEPPIHECKVGARDEHEERQDPLRFC